MAYEETIRSPHILPIRGLPKPGPAPCLLRCLFKRIAAVGYFICILTIFSAQAQFPEVASTASSLERSDVSIHRVILPEGIQKGDLLLVFWTDRNTGSTVIIPEGWDQLYNESRENRRSLAIFRIAETAEDPELIITTTNSGRSAHVAYRIEAGTYDGKPVTAALARGSGASPDPPNLTVGMEIRPSLWFTAVHASGDDNEPRPVAPPNFTNLITAYTGPGSQYVRTVTSERYLSAGSENPTTYALGSAVDWSAATICVKGMAPSGPSRADELSISKLVTAAPAAPGDPFNFSISYHNLNPLTPALNVTITDTLPGDSTFTYLSSVPPGTYNPVDRTLTWYFASLPANSSGMITVNGTCGLDGSLFGYEPASYYICSGSCDKTAVNTVGIDNPASDPSFSQTSTSLSQYCGPNLEPGDVTGYIKSSTPSFMYYVYTITNDGNITDEFLLTVDPNIPPTEEVLTFSIQTLAGDPLASTGWMQPGESMTFLLRVDCPTGTNPNNWNYSVLSATSVVCGTADTSLISTFIYGGQIPGGACDLSVTKSVTSNPMIVGNQYKYFVTVTNSKESAKNVRMEDHLPAGVSYVSSSYTTSVSGASVSLAYNAATHTLTGLYQNHPKDELNNGEYFQVVIIVAALCEGMPSVLNEAIVTTTTPDSDETNNTVTLETNVLSNLPIPTVNPPAPFICSGQTVTLTASGAPAGHGYKWYDAGGNFLSAANPFTTPALTATTLYFVSIYQTSAPACERS